MAEDKKDDHAEGGGASAEIIPQKYLTPILLIILVVGTIVRMISPSFAKQIGPMILDPFTAILWAYAVIVPLSSFMGGHKEGMKAWGGTMLIFVVALVIPIAWGYEEGMAGVIAPLIFMLILNALAVRYHKKAFGEEEKVGGEIDPKRVKEVAGELKEKTHEAEEVAPREESLIGDKLDKILDLLKVVEKFAHEMMRVKEKDLTDKEKGKWRKEKAERAEDLAQKIQTVDRYVYSVRKPLGKDDVGGKTLDELLELLKGIKSKLGYIHNVLTA